MNSCVRCLSDFVGRWPNSKICKACSKGGMPRGKVHWNYKNGRRTYHTIAKDIRDSRKYCERCGQDISKANRYKWVMHHKDHDQLNNDMTNLELLCKNVIK